MTNFVLQAARSRSLKARIRALPRHLDCTRPRSMNIAYTNFSSKMMAMALTLFLMAFAGLTPSPAPAAEPLEQIEVVIKTPRTTAVKGTLVIDEDGVKYDGTLLSGRTTGFGPWVKRLRPISGQLRRPARTCKRFFRGQTSSRRQNGDGRNLPPR
ncbi:MAG: hypothetical protein HC902_11520 [Calothrix sp. SM1_5_4]|nr:hypothetical protein [Calothrix sp. SM1_5_4]